MFLHCILCVLFATLLFEQAAGQAQIVLNGASITLNQGAYLVIDNPSSNAIVRNSGSIISEGENNVIKWNIGTTTGTYTIPWGRAADYFPISFTKTAGAGGGYFLFSTYQTGWQNSASLPTGITNFNRANGTDNSAFAVDRFWQINAQSYTTKPTLSNLTFTYVDAEYTAPSNTIDENALIAQRWNGTLSTWTDFAPAATVNTGINTVTVSQVLPADLFSWWDVTYYNARHWIASASSSWNTAANWSTAAGGPPNATVPTDLDDVYFDDVIDDDCTLDADVAMGSLTIDQNYSGVIIQTDNTVTITNGATFGGSTFVGGTADITVGGPLTLSGATFTSTSGILDLADDFTYTGGTFSHHNGTVRFSGTGGTQNIAGSATAAFNNLAVTNTSATPGVSVESNQNLRGILTLSANTVFDADGAEDESVFTLQSTNDNPTRDAAVGILPASAQITGNVRIQRFMSLEGPANTRIYRYISSPLQDGAVVDIQGEIPVTGTFTGASVCQGCVSSSQSMFAYTESTVTDSNHDGATNLNDGFIDFPETDNKEILAPGRGYVFYVRGDILPSALWDVSGVATQGNTTLPVTFTSSGIAGNDGWNLVGNPYPSTIDWNAASGWTKNNLDASIYFTDNGGVVPVFATWNGVTGTNGGSRYIAIGQAFWVKANADTPALTATENVKTPGIQTTFFREITVDNLLRIALVKGTSRDEVVVHFRPDATNEFDTHADSWKMENQYFNLSALVKSQKLSINSLPDLRCAASVDLLIERTTPGNYQLDFSSLDSFIKPTTITLLDRFTKDTLDINNVNTYNFTITQDPASQGSGRFTVQFKTTLDEVTIEQDGNALTSSYTEGNQWYLDGQIIPGATTQTIPVTKSGTYSVTVNVESCSTSASREFTVTGEAEALASQIRITPNPVVHELYIEIPDTFAKAREATLLNSLGQTLGTILLQQEEGKKIGKLLMSNYSSGVYILRIIDGTRRFDTKIFKQ